MAIDAATIWEIRADGAQANGGGFFDRDPGTSVDYSQQAAAQLTVADLATDGAGTGLSSATGGFTAAMAGNVVQISGGDLTAGWYEITAHTDTNNVTIDRSAGASKSGGTGNVGGAFDFGGALDANFLSAFVPGNIGYIRGGTYTLGENTISSVAGTAALPIRLIGYNTDRAVRPTGTDRPAFASSAYYLGVFNYWSLENVRAIGTNATGIIYVNGTYALLFNSKAENTNAGTYPAIRAVQPTSNIVACEGTANGGYGIYGGNCFYCYVHDAPVGFHLPIHVHYCIADTCSTYGIRFTSSNIATNCTVYNCGVGVYIDDVTDIQLILNCIIDSCTTGISALAETDLVVVLNCCLNNTLDFGANVDECFQVGNVTSDPSMTDPANGDFSIGTGSSAYKAGLDITDYIAGITV